MKNRIAALICIIAVVVGAIALINLDPCGPIPPAPMTSPGVEPLTKPQRPLTAMEKRFDDFGKRWQLAYNDYSIEKFEQSVRGQQVIWEGVTGTADRTGTQFDMVPRNQPTPCSDFEAVIVLRQPGIAPNLREPGNRIRVTGRISSVTISDVFIRADKIEAL